MSDAPAEWRTIDAATWCDRLRRVKTAFGVSRVGRTTKLDDLGIETAAAFRFNPVGASVSVTSGKGITLDQAEAGALGEALERYCAEPRKTSPPVRHARAGDLPGPSIDLRVVPLGAWVSEELLSGCLDWCRGFLLGRASPMFVPAELVFFPYAPTTTRQLLASPTTTGLAAAASLPEAILYGILECVERDAYARALAFVQSGKGDLIAGISPDALRPRLRERIGRLEARGFRVFFRDLTHDLDVPTVLAVVDDGELAHFGCASHPRSDVAAESALFEAAQSRITDLQGAREDLDERGGRPHPWFISEGRRTGGLPVSMPAADVDTALAAIGDRFDRAGAGDAVVVDLSIPAVPAVVVRTIVAQLEQWGNDSSRVGSRMRRWLASSSS